MADDLTAIIMQLTTRIRALEANQRAEVAGGVVSVLFAALPAPATVTAGALLYVSNGRKVGEGPGVGTGVLCYNDGTAWETCDTSTPVAI